MAKKPIIERTKIGIGSGKPKLTSVGAGEQRPVFDSLFGGFPAEQTPNPLIKLPEQEDPEEAATQEVSAALQHILDEKKLRRDQYRTMVDHEFWVAVCFQNREQKEEFLQKTGLIDLGDKYIDGLQVAERLNVDIQPINLPIKSVRAAPKLLRNEALIL